MTPCSIKKQQTIKTFGTFFINTKLILSIIQIKSLEDQFNTFNKCDYKMHVLLSLLKSSFLLYFGITLDRFKSIASAASSKLHPAVQRSLRRKDTFLSAALTLDRLESVWYRGVRGQRHLVEMMGTKWRRVIDFDKR